jgi:hypothetical protein
MTLLRRDPSSQFAASVEGWTRPASFEFIALAQLLDQYAVVHFKKPKPFPRPWDKEGKSVKRHGNIAGRTRAEVVTILNAHGHNLPA